MSIASVPRSMPSNVSLWHYNDMLKRQNAIINAPEIKATSETIKHERLVHQDKIVAHRMRKNSRLHSEYKKQKEIVRMLLWIMSDVNDFWIEDAALTKKRIEISNMKTQFLWLCAKHTTLGLVDLSYIFGHHHTSVLYSIRKGNRLFNDNVRGLGTDEKNRENAARAHKKRSAK